MRTVKRIGGRAGTLAALLGVALCGVAGGAASAQEGTRETLLVTADALAARLSSDDLVLLHVGPEESYAAEHIPGARYIELDMISAPEDHAGGTGLSLQLPEPAALERTLEGLGISDDSRIVVYWADEWATPAARVVFTLDWIGLGDRTALLDGGLAAWKAAGGAVTAEPPSPTEGRLSARPRPELVVDADWVLSHLDAPTYRIVDARAPVNYDGIQPTYLHRKPVRPGHIPGAGNLPVFSVLDEDTRLLPAAELRALFEAAGVRPGQTVVGYCHLGQYATLVLFAARTLGYPVRLYDGSFQEWGSLERLPVELPEGRE